MQVRKKETTQTTIKINTVELEAIVLAALKDELPRGGRFEYGVTGAGNVTITIIGPLLEGGDQWEEVPHEG